MEYSEMPKPELFKIIPDTSSFHSQKPPDQNDFNLRNETIASTASLAAIALGTVVLGERIDAYAHGIHDVMREWMSFNALMIAGTAGTIAWTYWDRIKEATSSQIE